MYNTLSSLNIILLALSGTVFPNYSSQTVPVISVALFAWIKASAKSKFRELVVRNIEEEFRPSLIGHWHSPQSRRRAGGPAQPKEGQPQPN